MSDTKLILDVGMHRGEDTAWYLKLGCNVVAVDADPTLVAYTRKKFRKQVKSGRLSIIHAAVTDSNNEAIPFNISRNTFWNSLKKGVAERTHVATGVITVRTRTLSSIMSEVGIPYYCKIDVEGYDEVCLRTLRDAPVLPEFISAETECVADGEYLSDEDALGVLNALHDIGYTKFKLVDQPSLCVLGTEMDFYTSPRPRLQFGNPSLVARLARRLKHPTGPGIQAPVSKERELLGKRCGYDFPLGSTGPFGNDLSGDWMGYTTARHCLLRHRKAYFSLPNAHSYGFWCDWHATS